MATFGEMDALVLDDVYRDLVDRDIIREVRHKRGYVMYAVLIGNSRKIIRNKAQAVHRALNS